MASGTKTFVVAALMAIVALCGSFGASNAQPSVSLETVDH